MQNFAQYKVYKIKEQADKENGKKKIWKSYQEVQHYWSYLFCQWQEMEVLKICYNIGKKKIVKTC